MKIAMERVYRDDDKKPYFRADAVDLPGMPPVGEGRTEAEAVADLFRRLLSAEDFWTKRLDLQAPIEIRSTYKRLPPRKAKV